MTTRRDDRLPDAIDAIDDHRREFLDAELQHLRSEDHLLRQEAWRVETYSVGASAAVVAWLATHSVTTRLAWCLPLAIVLAAGARFGSIMRHLQYRVRVYIAEVERRTLGPSGGWQTFSKNQSPNQALANWIIWSLLIVAAGWVAIDGIVLVPPTRAAHTTARDIVAPSDQMRTAPNEVIERRSNAPRPSTSANVEH